jgi:hypothetical protein
MWAHFRAQNCCETTASHGALRTCGILQWTKACGMWKRKGKGSLTKRYAMKMYPVLARLEVFTAVKIHVDVFWVVTPCSVVVRY